MSYYFEWDPEKAAANLRKHGVSFEEATTVFGDLLAMNMPDPDPPLNEERFVLLGMSHRTRKSKRVRSQLLILLQNPCSQNREDPSKTVSGAVGIGNNLKIVS